MSVRPQRIEVVPGLIVQTAAGILVNVRGTYPRIRLPAGYIPRAGDAVIVEMYDDRGVVLGPVTDNRRPLLGTVTGSASSGRVPVLGDDGQTYQARFIGTAPAVSDEVRFDWQSTEPWIMAGIPAPVPPPPPPPESGPGAPKPAPKPPTRPPQTGTTTYSATGMGRFRPGLSVPRWDTDFVAQGWWTGAGGGASQESRGAWFFGTAPRALKGRTVTRFEMYFPARRRIGLYNNTLSANVRRHTNNSRPGGDVNRVGSAESVSFGSSWSGGWKRLPNAMGQAIVNNGGGIAISGQPYLGFNRGSPRIRISWRR